MSNKSNFKAYSNGLCSFTIKNESFDKTGELAKLGIPERFGHSNGYIGVQELHPLFGVDYQDTGLYTGEELTYSDRQNINGCVYWVFGFDTRHFWNTLENTPESTVLEYVDAYVDLIANYKSKEERMYSLEELEKCFSLARDYTYDDYNYSFEDIVKELN